MVLEHNFNSQKANTGKFQLVVQLNEDFQQFRVNSNSTNLHNFNYLKLHQARYESSLISLSLEVKTDLMSLGFEIRI